jgi:hypothetical protein
MSLKAVDLQMALHRNDEAGIRQNQLQHKPDVDQSQLAEQAVRRADREREQAAKLEETAETHIKPGDSNGSGKRQRRGRKEPEAAEATAEEPKISPHPYKGHFIDVSL